MTTLNFVIAIVALIVAVLAYKRAGGYGRFKKAS